VPSEAVGVQPASEYVKRSERVVLEATGGDPALLTVTSAVPAAWVGEVTVIWVSELTRKYSGWTAAPPNVTPAVPVNPVPTMSTTVPPDVGPVTVPRELTAGAGPVADAGGAPAMGDIRRAEHTTRARVLPLLVTGFSLVVAV
jgi:hypothetical protein